MTDQETPTPETTPSASFEGLDIAAVVAERDEALARIDQLVRAYAEADNMRKRAEKDRADALKYGAMKLARDMLEVADNMRRALSALPADVLENAKESVEGLELTERTLIQAFERHSIVQIFPAQGEAFDPNVHEAMSQIPVPTVESGKVVETIQAGYQMGERLLRPARVLVAL